MCARKKIFKISPQDDQTTPYDGKGRRRFFKNEPIKECRNKDGKVADSSIHKMPHSKEKRSLMEFFIPLIL
jgi:hypothetical protein